VSRSATLLGVVLLALPAAAQRAQHAAPRAKAPVRGPVARAEDRETLMARAQTELAAGRRSEAARILRSVAERFSSVRALVQLADLESSSGDAAAALGTLRKAREIAPNSEGVLSALAQLSLDAGTPLPALLALEPLTRMCPTVARYHYLRGVALMQGGDMPAATLSFRQAQLLAPEELRTLVALGISLNNQKLYAEAKAQLTHGLDLAPGDAEAMAALSESEEGLGELLPAEGHAKRVLEKLEAHATANFVMGKVRLTQGRLEEARAFLETAAAADPGASRVHYALSLAYARLGDDARSREELARYQQTQKEALERATQLRAATGQGGGGMHP
jgi:tetratricopeptide (TPR) repeat protein